MSTSYRSGKRGPFAVAMLLSLAGIGGIGCLDVSPVTVDVPDTTPIRDTTPVTEVDPEAGDVVVVDARTPCQDCLETLCKAAIDECVALEKCKGTYACALANTCFASGDFETIVSCGIPCAKSVGLTDQTGPEAGAIISVVACATDKCKSQCALK